MSLKTLYKVWLLALLPAVLSCALYVAVATKWYLNHLPRGSDGDFAALPYLVYAHGLGIMLIGLFMAVILLIWPSFKANADIVRLAKNIFVLHIIVGSAALITLVKLNVAFIIFFNPLAFALVALLPYFISQITQKRSHPKGLQITASVAVALFFAQAIMTWTVMFTD